LHTNKKYLELEKVYKTTIKWIFYFTLPLLTLLLLIPSDLIDILFGMDYSAGSGAVFFLSISYFLSGFGSLFSSTLALFKKTKIIFYITISAAFVNIVLNWFLIQRIGITGAAISSFLTVILSSTLYVFLSYYYVQINPLTKNLIKPVISSFGSFFIFIFFPQKLLQIWSNNLAIVLIFGYLIGYFTFLVILKSLDEEDVGILLAIEKKTGMRNEKLRNLIRRFIK
jgi:O-antigen/teichoic acid export membrane protein